MEFSFSGIDGATGTVILAVVCWLGALLMGGLLTAHYRVSGLYRNGLLEKERLGPVLKNALEDGRRFQVTISTLYLSLTMLGCFAWGHLLFRSWSGPLDLYFYLLFIGSSLLAWSLGGLVFKMLAAGTAASYVQVVGLLIFPLNLLMRPWSTLMLAIMDRLDDTLWTAEVQPHLSTGEIRSLISEDGENLILDEDEREMIQSIFTFHDTAVREIMIPRIDMVCMEADSNLAQLRDVIIESKHSRIPVYDGTIDTILGVLYAKDLLVRDEESSLELAAVMRKTLFIPESKPVRELLHEFQEQKVHIAVVLDEYGGTAGLVTIDDTLESTQQLDLSDSSGFAVNDPLNIRLTNGDGMNFLEHPTGITNFGVVTTVLAADDIQDANNELLNAFVSDWTGGNPDNMSAVGGATVTQDPQRSRGTPAHTPVLVPLKPLNQWPKRLPIADRAEGTILQLQA